MDKSYGGRHIKPTPQNLPKWTGAMGEGLACLRLRTNLSGQELWGKPQHPDITPTSPGHHPDLTRTSPRAPPPYHQVPAYTLGTSSKPAKVTPNSPYDVRSFTGKARVTPPRWTGAMGEGLACQRLRAHLNGQEL